jgi:hypothetical protein
MYLAVFAALVVLSYIANPRKTQSCLPAHTLLQMYRGLTALPPQQPISTVHQAPPEADAASTSPEKLAIRALLKSCDHWPLVLWMPKRVALLAGSVGGRADWAYASVTLAAGSSLVLPHELTPLASTLSVQWVLLATELSSTV